MSFEGLPALPYLILPYLTIDDQLGSLFGKPKTLVNSSFDVDLYGPFDRRCVIHQHYDSFGGVFLKMSRTHPPKKNARNCQ